MKKTLLLLLTILSCLQINAQCWKTVTAGYSYTVATQTDNSLWSWGENKSGQLGDGTLINNYTPKKIGTATDWKIVVTGTNHTVALKNDGTLWAWGSNKEGQLGDGTSTNKSIPTQIGTATNWQTVAAGNQYTMALKNDGTLWAWGDNYFGELGTGNSSDSSIPKQVGTATDWKSITVGYFHTIALKTDGTLWTWGGNDDGQLGDGTTSKSNSPKKIGTATDWKIICGGGSHTLAIKTDGSLWAWGKNKYGELGNGTTTDSYVPTKIGTSTDWKSLGAAGDHTIAIKTDGSLWNWGYNSHNELGNGTTLNSLIPIQIGASKNWQDVAAGWYYTAAVSSDGVMWTFGDNADGQLGDGTNVNKNVPITVVCPSSFTMTTSQANITCFGDKNGSASVTSVSGGTTPYSYLWSNGAKTEKITGLSAGTYSCTVTDASSLSITKSFVITEPSPLFATTTITNTDCNGDNNGIITIIANGGTTPYQYAISNMVFQSSNIFTNLSAGVYELYVKDNNGCIVLNIVTVTAANTPPPTATGQTFNTGAAVTNLQATGSNVKWYNNITGGNSLSLLTALQTGKYYVSQTINGCESSRTVVDVTVTSLIPTYVPSNGLIAYYPFTGNANDVSGNGYNGTVTGAVLITDKAGNPNSAYSFDGILSYIDATIATIPQNNSPRTISGWFKTNSPNYTESNYSTIFNYGNLSTNQRFALSLYSKGYLDFISSSNFSNNDLGIQNNYLDNTWHFITITYDGTKVSLFIDGNYVDGKNITLNTINKNFRIGKRIDGDTNNEYFKGSIDDVGIWNRVLTPEEITKLYNSQNDANLYTLIPDVNFEKKLIALGIDSGAADGKVLTSNIDKLTTLDVSYSSITSLTGIEYFINLETLNCDFNKLATLDVSKNLNLKKIDCNYNQITTLDIYKNLNLKHLGSFSNKLTTLDVTKNIPLIELDCGNNQLTALDISKNVNLGLLRCPDNQLETLDVSTNVALDTLVSYSNKLSRLDISKNIILKEINCSSNKLISLNLKNGNNLNFVNRKLFFTGNPNLNCILVDDKTYSDKNWANSKDVSATYNTDCTQYTLIPDSNFEQKLIDLGIDTDGLNGKITATNISTITSLNLSNSNIKDLTGIEIFTALKILDCSNNQLVTLDLSKNTNLQILYVTGNPLVYLNLKNGNNQNLIVASVTSKKASNIPGTSFLGITTLGCVKVDSTTYSNANWSKIKETTTVYSETCTLGLEDSEFSKAIVYPNPTKGEINILNIALEKATVYNSLGQLVKTFNLDSANTNNTISLSGLPKGVYYIYLINQDAASAKKVIVE